MTVASSDGTLCLIIGPTIIMEFLLSMEDLAQQCSTLRQDFHFRSGALTNTI